MPFEVRKLEVPRYLDDQAARLARRADALGLDLAPMRKALDLVKVDPDEYEERRPQRIVLGHALVQAVLDMLTFATSNGLDEEFHTTSLFAHLATNLIWWSDAWHGPQYLANPRLNLSFGWAPQSRVREGKFGGDFGLAVYQPNGKYRIGYYQAKMAFPEVYLYRPVAGDEIGYQIAKCFHQAARYGNSPHIDQLWDELLESRWDPYVLEKALGALRSFGADIDRRWTLIGLSKKLSKLSKKPIWQNTRLLRLQAQHSGLICHYALWKAKTSSNLEWPVIATASELAEHAGPYTRRRVDLREVACEDFIQSILDLLDGVAGYEADEEEAKAIIDAFVEMSPDLPFAAIERSGKAKLAPNPAFDSEAGEFGGAGPPRTATPSLGLPPQPRMLTAWSRKHDED